MKEIWKDVVSYEGRYMVSNLGNVINTQTNRPLGKGKNTITLYNDDGVASGKTRAAIIAEAFLEKPQTTEDLWAVIIDKDKPITVDNVKWRYRDSERISDNKLLNKNINTIKRMLLDESKGAENFHKAIEDIVEKYILFKEKDDRLREINNLEERLAKLKEEFRNDYGKKG